MRTEFFLESFIQMNDLKIYGLVGGLVFLLGFYAGYSIKANSADIEKLELQQIALKAENTNLLEQLRTEHEWQLQAQSSAEKAQADLADIESRYSLVRDELLRMHADRGSADSSTLSDHAATPCTVPESTCKCPRQDTAKFQRLLERQLTIAKDCDITASYYNRLIELYQSISQ